MNYPIWELTTIGGGTLIAIIAIAHVYISHLAVGGGAFIWLTDLKGFRENNPKIHEYVRKHTWFFLLITMVYGGMTGVGIWFIIALVHPAATSALIHAYVFGWAIEWVFFVGEIASLLLYHYRFEHLSRRNRLFLAFMYFLFAWLSLVIINGIVTFMLTPGKWLETKFFWHGFFNPTYFPSLFFRSFVSAMFAGMFGYITVVFSKNGEFRSKMLRYCSKWTAFPFIGIILAGIWYYFSLPLAVRETAFVLNPQTATSVSVLLITFILIFLGAIFYTLKSGRTVQIIAVFVLIIIGQLFMGGFEYIREDARKPFVINQYLYSNGIYKSDADEINKKGILTLARWTNIKEITPENKLAAGKEIFNLECLSCHTVNGIRNDIMPQTELLTYTGMVSHLDGQGKILNYMPPFLGTQEEKEALAAYIVSEFHGKEITPMPQPVPAPQQTPVEIPPFDANNDEYVLFAWNDLGMHCFSDADAWLVILPPANTLEAQLIKRGETPEIITDGVTLTYKVEPGFENPADHVNFWDFAAKNFKTELEKNVGLAGKGLSGEFDVNEENMSFIAKFIPVTPYKDDGSYNPYPIFTVEARDQETGKLLATTKVVAPNSTEMGCRNCHGGPWRNDQIPGFADETAMNILKTHDRLSKTNLYEEAKNGNPRLCQDCHADPALNAPGRPDLLNLSAAMHGWHANYLPVDDASSCSMCHPAHPQGFTRCSRGVHSRLGVTCVNCHGTISEHALALLKGQAGKKGAERLMKNLEPKQVASKDEINPRTPWLNETDCLNCHVDFEKPEAGFSGYNQWVTDATELYRMRADNAGVRCPACHGSTHAEYPAQNVYSKNRDVIQPLQYTGKPYPIGTGKTCYVCHKKQMEEPIHHENMDRNFRNVAVWGK